MLLGWSGDHVQELTQPLGGQPYLHTPNRCLAWLTFLSVPLHAVTDSLELLVVVHVLLSTSPATNRHCIQEFRLVVTKVICCPVECLSLPPDISFLFPLDFLFSFFYIEDINSFVSYAFFFYPNLSRGPSCGN